MKDPKKGDAVSWNAPGGTAHGTVERKVTSRTAIKGHKVDASPENPQYIVKTDDGAKAAHKASALKRK